jgi:hypothetical protein
MNTIEIQEQVKVLKESLSNALREMGVLEDEINLLIKKQESTNAKHE